MAFGLEVLVLKWHSKLLQNTPGPEMHSLGIGGVGPKRIGWMKEGVGSAWKTFSFLTESEAQAGSCGI